MNATPNPTRQNQEPTNKKNQVKGEGSIRSVHQQLIDPKAAAG